MCVLLYKISKIPLRDSFPKLDVNLHLFSLPHDGGNGVRYMNRAAWVRRFRGVSPWWFLVSCPVNVGFALALVE